MMAKIAVVRTLSTYEISRSTPPMLTEYVQGLEKVLSNVTYGGSDPTCF